MNAHTITLDEYIEQMQDLLNCQFDVGITVADNPQVIVLRLSKTANVTGLPENLFLELTVYEDCLSTLSETKQTAGRCTKACHRNVPK